jgi:four helix bundle protein
VSEQAEALKRNYRAACRARWHAESTARIGVVAEEADEVQLWLELITEAKLVAESEVSSLHTEARELVAIFSAAAGTARFNDRTRHR